MDPVLLDEGRRATHEAQFERVFIHRKYEGIIVEVHRALTNPYIFNIEEDEMWEASRVDPRFNSNLVRVLSPEDTLLHLAVHAFRDLDFCTHNVLDAHEAWHQWQPDTEQLAENAQRWGAKKVLFYLLVNCREIMGTPVPDKLLDRLNASKTIDTLNSKILNSVALKESGTISKSYRALQLLSQITFPDRPARGLRFQGHYAMTRLKDLLTASRQQ